MPLPLFFIPSKIVMRHCCLKIFRYQVVGGIQWHLQLMENCMDGAGTRFVHWIPLVIHFKFVAVVSSFYISFWTRDNFSLKVQDEVWWGSIVFYAVFWLKITGSLQQLFLKLWPIVGDCSFCPFFYVYPRFYHHEYNLLLVCFL